MLIRGSFLKTNSVISQIVNGDCPSRSGDEVDEVVLTYSEVKSLAVGNPLIKRKIELETELQRKLVLKSKHERARTEAAEQLLQLPGKEQRIAETARHSSKRYASCGTKHRRGVFQ